MADVRNAQADFQAHSETTVLRKSLSDLAVAKPSHAVHEVPPAAVQKFTSVRAPWAEFYEAAHRAEGRRIEMKGERTRSRWHPSSSGYAMVRDPEAEEELEDYTLGSTIRPGRDEHERDEHTSDEESEEEEEGLENNPQLGEVEEEGEGIEEGEGSGEESGEGESESESGSERGAASDGSESAPPTPQSVPDEDSLANTVETPTLDDGESGSVLSAGSPLSAGSEKENSFEDDDPNALPPPPSSSLSPPDSGVENDSVGSDSSHSFLLRPLPPSFDPSLRSPIFFGYTLSTLASVNLCAAAAASDKSGAEAATAAEKIEEKRAALVLHKSDSSSRKESRKKRLAALQKQQAAATVQRVGEYAAMERSMDPNTFRQLKSQFDVDESAASLAADLEREELEAHNEKVDREETIKTREKERDIMDSVSNESNVLPAGSKLEKTARADMKECVAQLDEAADFLDDAQGKLEAMQEELKGSENDRSVNNRSVRSMLILVEGQVEEGERRVEKCLDRLERQELLLMRALRRKAMENQVLPLYSPLASSMAESDFSVPFVPLICALVVVCTDNVSEKLRFLVDLFDVNDDEFLAVQEMTCLVSSVMQVLSSVGFIDRAVDEEEVHSLVIRAFYQMQVDHRKGMTRYEARQWSLKSISQNRFLATLFGADWKYGEMSVFQRQIMHPNRQYEIGLISMPDLKFHAAKRALDYKPCLDPLSKASVHERALAMGADDPNKPDYSKFLPKKSRRVQSNVVPLDHGHLANLTSHHKDILFRSAKKLQNVYRGRQARARAEELAKREAFYAARGIAVEGMKEKVAGEFRKRESGKGIARMKWDAAVRKKQVQLRAGGRHFDRDGVVELLMDEAAKAGTEEIGARFHELAVARGFEERKEERPADENVLAKVGSQLATLAQAKGRNAFAAVFNRGELNMDTGQIVTPRAESEEVRTAEVRSRHDASLTVVRRAAMIRGVFPKELYEVGESFSETFLRFSLAHPNPSSDAVVDRLRAFDMVMTSLKAEDIMMELPSKRLLLKYVLSPHWKDDMMIFKDFDKHFRILRNSGEIVKTLRAVAESDLEVGVVAKTYDEITAIPDHLLKTLVTAKVQQGLTEAGDRLEKMSRSNELKSLSRHDKVLAAIEKDDLDLKRRLALVVAQGEAITKLHKRLASAQVMLDEAERKREGMVRLERAVTEQDVEGVIAPAHRLNWMERYWLAKAAPEKTEQESEGKYYELSSLAHDFLNTAKKSAMIIVDEMAFPKHEKSILPTAERDVDGRASEGGRGDRGVRYKYDANGIYFKIFTDDDGLFNGSDEAAAKAAGNDVLASLEYSKCHIEGVVVPFQAVIDYAGFRVLAVAKLPVNKVEFNEAGDVKRSRTEHVLGTTDRGLTVVNQNRYLDTRMEVFAKKLNLARHFVKGENDLNEREVYSSVDVRGFKGVGNVFFLLNFWRAMPSENPDFTDHLDKEPRGNSIFSRLLRPEFVQAYKKPLSANANTNITLDVKGWIESLDDNEEATKHLVGVTIPDFCEQWVTKKLNDNPSNAYGIDVGADLHRNGINIRHIGLIRSKFWRKMVGTCNFMYHKEKILPQRDYTAQLKRGDQLKIRGELFRVSTKPTDEFSEQAIHLDRKFEHDSCNFLDVYAGEVSTDQNSQEVRQVLLAEMVARTMKNLLRLYLRHAAKKMKISVQNIQLTLMTEFLNIITGSNVNSESFWQEQLFMGIVNRFGRCAIAETERKVYRVNSKPMTVYIVKRFTEMFGIQLTNDAIAHLYQTPDMFKFVYLDINNPAPRVKHNIYDVEFSDAVLLSHRADRTRSFDYQNILTKIDKPYIYWKFSERKGSRVAHNYGTSGREYGGVFSARCDFEFVGPVVNDELNRAVEFHPDMKCKVDTKYSVEVCPHDVLTHFAVEGWCKLTGSNGTNRIVVMTGRCALMATREETWAFVVYEEGVEVAVLGPPVDYDEFHHVVGTYDGCLASLYVDSVLVKQIELRPEIAVRTQAINDEKAEALRDLGEREKEVRDATKESSEKSATLFLTTKDGRNLIRQNAMKLVEHSEFKMKMDKNAAGKGLTRLNKKDAQTQAITEYKLELYMKNVQAAAEEYRILREEIADQQAKGDEYARELLEKSMVVGSSVASRRSKEGRNFFHGHLAHVAVYTHCLAMDRIREHYQSAIASRTPQADRLYSLAAVKFNRALKLAPNDPAVLAKYAENLCNYLDFDVSDKSGDRKSMRKVHNAIKEFTKYHNVDGLAEILRRLPADPDYADLACDAYKKITAFLPNYFTQEGFFPLKELSFVPFKFQLTDAGTEPFKVGIAADMFRKVVSELSLSLTYGGENLKWLGRIKSDAAVVTTVVKAQSDADHRVVDLTMYHDCSDITDDDLLNIADNHRMALVLNISNSQEVTDRSLIASSRCCSSLQALTVDGCSQLTGRFLDGLKNFTPNLKLLSCQQCKFIDDEYLIPMLSACSNLTVVNLNNCDLVSDDFLRVAGGSLRSLELLHMAFCTSITDEGLYQFAVTANPDSFTSLDLTCCRSITDDGLVGIAEKLKKLKYLNVCGVNRCTEVGGKAITHNCWDLEYLNFEDLDLLTDDVFHFDISGDGRRAADENMLGKVTDLNVSECSRLTDHGLGGISQRCPQIETLNLSGCALLTDETALYLTKEPKTGMSRGEGLKKLKLSYCMLITDEGLLNLGERCTKIERIDLEGLVHLTDEGIRSLVTKCTSIQNISLGRCKRLTDKSLCNLADFLWIEELDISNSTKMTDEGVDVVCMEFTGLLKLNLSHCDKVTDRSIVSLGRHCKHLRELQTVNCSGITKDSLGELKGTLPKCNILGENFDVLPRPPKKKAGPTMWSPPRK